MNNTNHALLDTSYQYGYNPLGLTDAITTTVQGVPSVQTLTHDAAGRLVAPAQGTCCYQDRAWPVQHARCSAGSSRL